ncbi:YHS domain-containing protein, partial [Escherichia coli]
MDHGHHVHHAHGHRRGHGAAYAAGEAATDPVCGMRVDPAATPHHAEHDHATYHFCSAGCRAKFVAEPARYLTADKG